MKSKAETKGPFLSTREMVLFSMLAALMFVSKVLMEFLPNIHFLGVLTMVYTLTFRKKALIPIYLYVFLNGLFAGFSVWWIPYLYLWTLLWGATMLLPKKMPIWLASAIYPTLCCLHGLLFGALYAPVQAIAYGFTLEQTIAWIVAGLRFDVLHAVGNFSLGLLILPLSTCLKSLWRRGKF